VVVFTSGLHGKNVIIDERIVHWQYELLEAIVVGLRRFTESIVPIARKPASTQFKPDMSGPRQGGRTALRELVPSVARHFRWLTSVTYSNGSINR
jgi:hypothetical protein